MFKYLIFLLIFGLAACHNDQDLPKNKPAKKISNAPEAEFSLEATYQKLMLALQTSNLYLLRSIMDTSVTCCEQGVEACSKRYLEFDSIEVKERVIQKMLELIKFGYVVRIRSSDSVATIPKYLPRERDDDGYPNDSISQYCMHGECIFIPERKLYVYNQPELKATYRDVSGNIYVYEEERKLCQEYGNFFHMDCEWTKVSFKDGSVGWISKGAGNRLDHLNIQLKKSTIGWKVTLINTMGCAIPADYDQEEINDNESG